MIGGLHPCSFNDFPGHLAAVVFTRGCNLRCRYCHNPSLCSVSGDPTHTVDEVASFLRTRAGKLTGVVVTGGEPSLHRELSTLLRTVRSLGFATKLDTNGMRPSRVAGLLDNGYVGYLAVDVKVAPGSSSSWLCGQEDQAELALETLGLAVRAGVQCEARTTVVRQVHGAAELASIARGVGSVGVSSWRIQPVRSNRVLDPSAPLEPPDLARLSDAVSLARSLGVNATVRNAEVVSGRSTWGESWGSTR